VSKESKDFESWRNAPEVPKRFLEKICLGDEDLDLNPWVAYALAVLLDPEAVKPYTLVPGKREEVDILVTSVFKTNLSLICELKSGRSGTSDAKSAVGQAGDYVARFAKAHHGRLFLGLVVKELVNEKGLLDEDLKETWARAMLGLCETYSVVGIIAPSWLWRWLMMAQAGHRPPILREIFQPSSKIIIDDTYKSKLGDFLIKTEK
jgi:hypothetical protein